MKTFLMIGLAAFGLAACGSPPCLADNQPGRVVSVGIPNDNSLKPQPSQYLNTVKLRLSDGTIRVCNVPEYVGMQLQPGDVLRGPITHDRDSWVQ